MKNIKIKDQDLAINWNAKAFYLFGKNEGNIEEISTPEKMQNSASSFANVVLLVWAMLDDECRKTYPKPEDVAPLLLPLPDASVMAEINQEIQNGNKEML